MTMHPQRRLQRDDQREPMRRVIYRKENQFDFDRSRIPKDMSYQWKRVTLAGQEDTENLNMAELNGWTPVPANRHPELVGPRRLDERPIIIGGQMLMEQPKVWEQEARSLDDFAARNVVEEMVQKIGKESRRRGTKGVKRSMESMGELVE